MEKCKNCGTTLVIKQTKKTPEQLTKAYYYTAYYLCPHCHKLYHNDKFKVENNTLFTKPAIKLSDIDVEIWTDGACSNNGKPTAKASWAFVSGEYEEAGLVKGKQTNNTGEGFAILHALKWAVIKGYKHIKINSDSQISLNNLQKPAFMVKENKELFMQIEKEIENNQLQVLYEKVPGHSDNVNNNRADKLANGLVGIR